MSSKRVSLWKKTSRFQSDQNFGSFLDRNNTSTHSHTHARSHARTHSLPHACSHTHTRTHAHTHTRTQNFSPTLLPFSLAHSRPTLLRLRPRWSVGHSAIQLPHSHLGRCVAGGILHGAAAEALADLPRAAVSAGAFTAGATIARRRRDHGVTLLGGG